jgi:hypothetical protein
MGDTGTPTWTLPSGWTQLFARNNTCSTICAYKISNGSEPTSVTMGSTVNETYNGCIISIEDVDTTNPFGSTPTYTDANKTMSAGGSYTFTTISTTVANSLCLAFVASSGVGQPIVNEGPILQVVSGLGQAESMGVGWFFMPSTGTTPNNVGYRVSAAGNGVEAVIQIAAPSGGATKVPTYQIADNSIYINDMDGAIGAANADTNVGTTLGGITASDGTTTSATGQGLNYFKAGNKCIWCRHCIYC